MATNERAKERERTPSNVRPFTPRSRSSESKTDHRSGDLAKDRDVVDSDDAPGPFPA